MSLATVARITRWWRWRDFVSSLLAACVALGLGLAASSVGAADLNFTNADFNIMSADGARMVGHCHYSLTPEQPGFQLLYGEGRYLSGEYDVERDRLRPGIGGVPALVSFEHIFYRADGSPERMARADFRSGEASCTRYENGRAIVESATLDFPVDTSAGAVVTLPMQRHLRDDPDEPIELNDFTCAPGPKILKVKVSAEAPAPWNHYPGDLIRVTIKPDLGWLNLVLAPFLPEIHAWFDPANGNRFVGAQMARFYRGPKVILAAMPAHGVKVKDDAKSSNADARADPPASAAPGTPSYKPGYSGLAATPRP
jgi:hypothetical protein